MRWWKTGFSRKLHVAFATLLLTTLGLAWYFYDSVRWYEYDVQRIALANHVLQGYLEISNHTIWELNHLAEAVASGQADPPAIRVERAAELRQALSQVRQGIGEEVALEGSGQEIRELDTLEDIAQLVDEVIRAGDMIHRALREDNAGLARSELARLRSADFAELFDALVASAIEEQQRDARAADEDAIELAHYITRALPVFVTALVLITFPVVLLLSGSLTRSVKALQEGAQAVSAGNLGYRIPDLGEREFQRLGEAFNTMAQDLSDHRKQLHDANVGLEATVEERTRALKDSNQKLAELDAKRRKLLADISHELRTPLTVMRGEAEIALRGQDKSNDSYKEAFRRIVEQADHTTRLVDDLLFIARADAGEPRLKFQILPLVDLLQSVCADFSTRAAQHQLQIVRRLPPNRIEVMGDPGRLRQVFAILVDNALRYSRPGGEVTVALEMSRDEVQVTVRDQGIGLSAGESEHAFERFYRGTIAQEHARGTGLGLPVAKAIVQAHNGRITLEGIEGEGAIATVVLPAKDHLRVVA